MVKMEVRYASRFRTFFLLFCFFGLQLGCASSGVGLKFKEAKSAFEQDDFNHAEAILYSAPVVEDQSSRLQTYLWLSSVAIGQGLYEKAIYYLERGRDLAVQLRSDRGFEFSSRDYKSNPIEFSLIYYLLVISRWSLADSGKSPAWGVPEIRLKSGQVLSPKKEYPERNFSPQEVDVLRGQARADLLAWDSHLSQLGRSYGGTDLYHLDPMARILGSFLHGKSALPRERRTAELLAQQALREAAQLAGSLQAFRDGEQTIQNLSEPLIARTRRGPADADESLFLLHAGFLPNYREKRVVVGLSSLFRGVEDPFLRSQLEQIGLRLLIQYAPEFGLVAFAGAMAGAVGSSSDHGPVFISDAVDEVFGFEMRFPEMEDPVSGFSGTIELRDEEGRDWKSRTGVVGPIQELIARETRERSKKEWKEKALKLGLEYLALLVPAVIAYDRAAKDGDWVRKLAILTGFVIAKKTIDRLNAPDLRIWSLLPSQIFAACLKVPPGKYHGHWTIQQAHGPVQVPLDLVEIPPGGGRVILQHWSGRDATVTQKVQ